MTWLEKLLIRFSRRLVQGIIALWLLALLGALAGWWPVRWQWGVYAAFTLLATVSMVRWTRVVRERFVREATLPQFLQRKLRETYPTLSAKDCELVERGLRQFFLACLRSDENFVAMPSQAVDAMWHAFILHTRAYKSWCDNALGFFLDHTPAEVLGKKARHNDGLRRAWYWACKDEAINPRTHPAACRCCWHWMPNWTFRAVFTTPLTAPTSAPASTPTTMGAEPISAPASRMAASLAARMISAAWTARTQVPAMAVRATVAATDVVAEVAAAIDAGTPPIQRRVG